MDAASTTNSISLTSCQTKAIDSFMTWLSDSEDQVFVLEGYSGTGKSFVVRHILEEIPNQMKVVQLLNPQAKDLEVVLTATTNKAVEALSEVAKASKVMTIHSALKLTVVTNYETNTTKLVARDRSFMLYDTLLFIDEASFIDSELLGWIFRICDKSCKIVFIGDPAQLCPFKSNDAVVFTLQASKARMTTVVRQADGNPIKDVGALLRDAVPTGELPQITVDGQHIVHMSGSDFEAAIAKEFTRDSWRYSDSKILCWTNKTVLAYNHYVNGLVTGVPVLEKGDYAQVNSFVQGSGKRSLKTDQSVYIEETSQAEQMGLQGRFFTILGEQYFMPDSVAEKKALERSLRAEGNVQALSSIDRSWVDLRACYASTVDKSQGSTYDKVFIDLTDIGKCRDRRRVARMLYVAFTRARTNVYLYGDVV